jgi:hypothetical protein
MDRQSNDHKKTRTNLLNTTQKTKDWVTRTPHKKSLKIPKGGNQNP